MMILCRMGQIKKLMMAAVAAAAAAARQTRTVPWRGTMESPLKLDRDAHGVALEAPLLLLYRDQYGNKGYIPHPYPETNLTLFSTN